jgi:hypothetical protein
MHPLIHRARIHHFATLLGAEVFLLFLLAGSAALVWRSVPTEGVKLHGNIDTGIDLLGSRSDILWVTVAGTGAAIGNVALAFWLKQRERLASFFLLGTTLAVLLGFTGALWFIWLLNRPQ